METLITIGVVIYILVSIRKAMSYGKDKAGAKKPARGGWQEKLQEMARQIKEDMEKAQREAQGLPPLPAPAPPPLPDQAGKTSASLEWESLEENAEPLTMEERVDEESQDLELQVPGELAMPETGSVPAAGAAEPARLPSSSVSIAAGKKKQPMAGPGRAALKRAVIWSEILGKPLSLRD